MAGIGPLGGGIIQSSGGGGGGGGGALGGSLVFLQEQIAAASVTLDFTSFISALYDAYLFEIIGLVPATSTAILWMRMGSGGGPTWDAGANYGSQLFRHTWNASALSGADSGANQIPLTTNWLSTGVHPIDGSIELFSPASTALNKFVAGKFVYPDSTLGNMAVSEVGGQWNNSATAISGVRFLMSSGNITSGVIRVYGIQHILGGGSITAHGCRATRAANLALGNTIQTLVPFTANVYDTDTIHNTGVNNSRFVIPALTGVTTGLWSIKFDGYTDSTNASGSDVIIGVNGAGVIGAATPIGFNRRVPQGSGVTSLDAACDYVFTAGDYFEFWARTLGVAGNLIFDTGISPHVEVAFLGKVT